MLDKFRKSQRWLTGIFVLVIGGVFVFFLGLGGSPFTGAQPAGQAVVEVGDIVVSRADYLRQRDSQVKRFSEALGDQFDAKAAADFIDSQTMRQLVDAAVMAHAALELGLTVTRTEIQRYLRSGKRFRGEDGRFAIEAFEDWVEYNFGTQRAFMTLMRQDLLRSKLQRLLANQATVTDTEARSVALHRLQGIELGYVSLDTESLPAASQPTDEVVESYLADNEAEVRAIYEQRSDSYQKPEARKARHILFGVERGADEAAVSAARKNAEDAMARIVEGAAFEDVARELSSDGPSRTRGGEIGYVVLGGETLPELEEAIFAVEPGGEMRVTQTDSGFHLVRVDEKREASSMPFEAVSLDLARELAVKQMAKQAAESLADELAAAIRSGRSLEDAARDAGVSYQRSPTLRRRADGYLPEIGTSTDLMATAFGLTVDRPTSPRVFAIDKRRTLIELIERHPPEAALLEEEVVNAKEALLTQKRDALMQTWLDQHRSELNARNELLIDTSIAAGG